MGSPISSVAPDDQEALEPSPDEEEQGVQYAETELVRGMNDQVTPAEAVD